MKRYIFVLILAGLAAGTAGYFYIVRKDMKIIPANIHIAKRDIVLYFSSKDEEYLVPETRQIGLKGSTEEQIAEVIEGLIGGSKDLINIIPSGVKINGLKADKNGTVYIDFSKELKENHPKGSWAEMLTVYSIVNTITNNFSDIKRVKILLEGKEIDTLVGHIDMRRPFTENMEIVRRQ